MRARGEAEVESVGAGAGAGASASAGERTALAKPAQVEEATPLVKPLRVAIVGVPNTGKSLLFHKLTKKFTLSANYPYTTTQVQEATVRIGGQIVVLLDTPGITGLELCSEDEAVTRQLLHTTPPDIIVQCIDAANLVRSLILTAQLADLEIPMVGCLTMVDQALGRGTVVDVAELTKALGLPVQAACALDGRGVQKVADCLFQARQPKQLRYPEWVQERLNGRAAVASQAQQVEKLLAAAPTDLQPGQSVWHAVLETHRHWAHQLAERVVRSTGLEPEQTFWERLADLALHPLGAWVFLLGAVVGLYLLVAKIGIGLLADGLERSVAAPSIKLIATWTGEGVLREILVGKFGLISLGLFNALFTVLPILGVFYLVTGLLEDIGYFPLLSVQFDRLLRWVGLTGRAVLPMSLGFGCNAMATLAARTLPARQRFIACFLIALGVPCGAQLSAMVAILANLPLLAVLGLVATIIVLMVGCGTALSLVLPKCERGEFLVELPPLRAPQWRNIMGRTYHRLREFFLEACPLFIAGAGLLLVLDFTGLLNRLRELFAPVVVGALGLPREGTDMLLMTLARREMGALMLKQMAERGLVDLRQIFVSLLVMVLFVPCMTNTLFLGRVVGWRRTVVIFITVILVAMGVGSLVNVIWR